MSTIGLMTQIKEMFIVLIAHPYFITLFIDLIVIKYLLREYFLRILIAHLLGLPNFIIVYFIIDTARSNRIVFREVSLVFYFLLFRLIIRLIGIDWFVLIFKVGCFFLRVIIKFSIFLMSILIFIF